MPKSSNRKFQFSLRARVAVPGYADTQGLVVARTQEVTAENSYRVEFSHAGHALSGSFGESGLRAANPAPPPLSVADVPAGGMIESVLSFARACLRSAPGASIAARELYQAYLRWAVDRALVPATETRFGLVMGATHTVNRAGRVRHYLDITLVKDKPARKRKR